MAKTKTTKKPKAGAAELDSTFFLKLVLYVIIGAQWLRFTTASGSQVPLPIGLFIGILFVQHDHFRIDRKIEMAVLLVAMMIGFYGQVGVFVNL